MKEYVNKITGTQVAEYNSISEFYKYLCNTPTNSTFAGHQLLSQATDSKYVEFSNTANFEAAVELMKNGWDEGAKKMTKSLNVKRQTNAMEKTRRSFNSVAGFQPNVALFMAGVPENMINQKMVAKKQKIVTLTKAISYSGSVSAYKIIEESVKALQIVENIERMGYRVNLNVLRMNEELYGGSKTFATKVRIKNASEKLNISKAAFALAHPAMLRRLMFRWNEVYPLIPSSYVGTYGSTSEMSEVRKTMQKDEYLLPNFIKMDIEKITCLEDLLKL